MARIGDDLMERDVALRGAVTDAQLIVLIASDDRVAFAELYRRYGTISFRLARRVTRDHELAEAVVQEAFLAVWRQAARFDGRRSRPSTWLLTITHHKAVDVVRREEVRRTEPMDQLGELVDEAIDPPHEAWLGVQRGAVQDALASLSDPQREVIELAYFSGYTQQQLAQLLGQPLGTVKSRTHTALTRLRTLLEGAGLTAEMALAAI